MCKKTLYKKARAIGYEVRKGFQHNLGTRAICRDCHGDRYDGYMIRDDIGNWHGHDCYYDFTWTLEDIENFIRGVYESQGLEF